MAQENNTPKILACLLVGIFTLFVGWAMLNIAVGIIGGIVMFVFLLCHDD